MAGRDAGPTMSPVGPASVPVAKSPLNGYLNKSTMVPLVLITILDLPYDPSAHAVRH